jgi:hypothetical protein
VSEPGIVQGRAVSELDLELIRQWVEKIALLLLAVYNGIWEELLAPG